jgi:hypothetical protein
MIQFNSTVVGGTVLVRSAIQSANYVAGVSGWTINQDGSYELGSGGTFRGDVLVLDSSGASVAIITNNGGKIQFTPPTTAGLALTNEGSISSSANATGGGEGYTFTTINSPDGTFNGHVISAASLFLGSSRSDGAPFPPFSTPDSLMEFNGDIQGHGNFYVDKLILANSGYPVLISQIGVQSITFAAAVSNVTPVVFPIPFTAGVIPFVTCNINSGSGTTARWVSRAISVSNTGFSIFSFRTDAADAAVAWAAIPVAWSASTDQP